MNYFITTPQEEHELIRYHSEKREYRLLLHGYDYGLEEVFAEEWEKLPEEYKTDAWWKKRGL
ncbi:hypothetical protein RHORCCE3_0881 [Rickettsia hoogstraalii str. RCCE3]|nr:hypothetical protein RHORCCE3_0881 [Rickettsia hoogstraalii str. RCCE3]